MVARLAQPCDPFAPRFAFENLSAAEDLQARLARVVDHDQSHTIVRANVSCADELFVAPEIGEGEGMVVDDFEKPLRPAAMLNIRPPA